ncbi:unnamed protein product [Blepharisma stoltei]|uniref:Inosine/uridine-preferring nucleoside hydrolase domain-containing protein n=1 Tax=Blepharisma stoltei TaxID=1481888 RepID=A0AAU9IC83_9CILI|nr:unnamed protein product [Blepharisma stoltei]
MAKWIVDTDAGIDDAQALILGLSTPGFDIIAITTVTGNTKEEDVFYNTSEILRVCDREDIPIYRGARSPILRNNVFASHFHGIDGLGEYWSRHERPSFPQRNLETASQAIVRLSKEHSDLSLLCLGPLTNFATALLIDPNIKFTQVIAMGGNSNCIGNITQLAEFNFYADPEAAQIVLKRYPFTTLVTWELTFMEELLFDKEKSELWYSDTKKGEFIRDITSWVLDRCEKTATCDSVAMAVAIDQTLIMEYEDQPGEVCIENGITSGMVIVYRNKQRYGDMAINIRLINKINAERFWEMMFQSTKG